MTETNYYTGEEYSCTSTSWRWRGLKRVPRRDLDKLIQCAFLLTCAGITIHVLPALLQEECFLPAVLMIFLIPVVIRLKLLILISWAFPYHTSQPHLAYSMVLVISSLMTKLRCCSLRCEGYLNILKLV